MSKSLSNITPSEWNKISRRAQATLDQKERHSHENAAERPAADMIPYCDKNYVYLPYAITEQRAGRRQTSYKPMTCYRRVPKEVFYRA